jgi:hypothetical protein
MSTESTITTPSGRDHLDGSRLAFWADLDVHDQAMVDAFIAAIAKVADDVPGSLADDDFTVPTTAELQSDHEHLLTCDFCLGRQKSAAVSFAQALEAEPGIASTPDDLQTRQNAIAKAMTAFDSEHPVAAAPLPTAAKPWWQFWRRSSPNRSTGMGSVSGSSSSGFAIKPSFALAAAAALTVVTGFFLIQNRGASKSAGAPVSEAAASEAAAMEATATEAAAAEAEAGTEAGTETMAAAPQGEASATEAASAAGRIAPETEAATDTFAAAGSLEPTADAPTAAAPDANLEMDTPPSFTTEPAVSVPATVASPTTKLPATTAAPVPSTTRAKVPKPAPAATVTTVAAVARTSADLTSVPREESKDAAATKSKTKATKATKATKSAKTAATTKKRAGSPTTAAASLRSAPPVDLGDLGSYDDAVGANQAIDAAAARLGLSVGQATTSPNTVAATSAAPTTAAPAPADAPATTSVPAPAAAAAPATTSAPAVAATPAAPVDATPTFEDAPTALKVTLVCPAIQTGARGTGRVTIAGRALLVVLPATTAGTLTGNAAGNAAGTVSAPVFVDPTTCAVVTVS